jgi:hypothetical protein
LRQVEKTQEFQPSFGDEEINMQLDDKLVNKIVDEVVQRLSAEETPPDSSVNRNNRQNTETPGVFQNMDDCIPAAVDAQKKLLNLPFDTRRRIIQATRDTGKAHAAEYGRMEFDPRAKFWAWKTWSPKSMPGTKA